jgi:Holliday junction resolvase-like predicted endonuclease
MDNLSIGKIGELRVSEYLIRNNFEVFFPIKDGGIVDLIATKDNKIIKIQVKTTSFKDKETAVLQLQKQRNHPTKGTYYHIYTPDEIDFFALWIDDENKIAWINCNEAYGQTIFTLRKSVPKNNQTKGINLLENFLNLSI